MRGCRAGGFTLIEVLVALLIVAIGIAGAAGAQLSSMRARHGASLGSRASELASTLADRMRANAAHLRAGDGSPYAGLNYDAARDGAPAASTSCFNRDECSAAQMAQFDVDEVRAALYHGFPGGRIVVCRDGAAWDAARRSLSWDCAPIPAAPLVIKIGWRGKDASGATDGADHAPALAMAVEVLP